MILSNGWAITCQVSEHSSKCSIIDSRLITMDGPKSLDNHINWFNYSDARLSGNRENLICIDRDHQIICLLNEEGCWILHVEIPARGATRAEFLLTRGMARPLVDRRRWEDPARRKVRGPTIPTAPAGEETRRRTGPGREEESVESWVEVIASRCAVHPLPLFTVDERNRGPVRPCDTEQNAEN